jgi:hypothetical protein
MKSEVRKALQEITENKTTGIDELPIELIKAAGEAAITALCQQIWTSTSWPPRVEKIYLFTSAKKR